MIPIQKGNSPDVLEGQRCRNTVEQNVAQQRFGGSHYKNNQVKEALRKAFSGKCAYCESSIAYGATLHVEHYRPKNKVKEDPGHPGYYWLGHEWNNLLWACQACNNKKGTNFPTRGSYVRFPLLNDQGRFDRSCTNPQTSPLADEHPLLLRPDTAGFRPQDHLRFEPDGSVLGLSPEGIETIKTIGLLRGLLVTARKKIIDNECHSLRVFIAAFEQNIIGEDGLRFFLRQWRERLFSDADDSSDSEFIQLRRQALIGFEAFYLAALPQQIHSIIRDLFIRDQIFKRPLWWLQQRPLR